jgi:hypothetical protein
LHCDLERKWIDLVTEPKSFTNFFSYCSQGTRESPWSFLSVPRSQADA